jgi:thiol-disulfide isomerase/thioredoxin
VRVSWGLAPLILALSIGAPADAQQLIARAERTPAPALDLDQIGGPTTFEGTVRGRLTSADLKGKIVVVDLWAPGCVPCGPIHESLTQLAPALQAKGVVVLSLGVAEDSASAMSWVNLHGGATFPVALVPRALFEALEIASFPRMLLVDAKGAVAFDGHAHAVASFLPRVVPFLVAERDGMPPPADANRLN